MLKSYRVVKVMTGHVGGLHFASLLGNICQNSEDSECGGKFRFTILKNKPVNLKMKALVQLIASNDAKLDVN